MDWIWITAVSSIILFYLLQKCLNQKNLPPGPKGLPIIGHFHLLGKNPHQDLCKLAQKHGPIMYMHFGAMPTVVVSSAGAAELFLKTHDLNFCNRPHHEASYYLSYQQRNVVFGRYDTYWRNMRKLVTLELLSGHKVQQFKPMREAEVGLLISSLKQAAERREAVDLSVKIMAVNGDMTCLMLFGKKYADKDLDKKGFKSVIKETMREAAAFNLGDYFPYLRRLELQGSARRLKNLSSIFDGFLEKIIDEHLGDKKETTTRDFVDTMMGILESGEAGFQFDRRNVKAILLDMLVAGMDTSASVVEWTLSEIIKHPTVMKKLQEELKEVVGLDHMVEESHLPELKYLECVVKESLRIHPVSPLVIHESIEDCVVDGFNIPKQTRVLINIWAIGRDSKAWPDPEIFLPERFIGSSVDLRGRDFDLIPFGSGRRGCPGLQLGLTIVQLMVAQLVHCFDWELADGESHEDMDMSEVFGLVTTRAKHLMAIPTYRLPK